MKLTYRGVSYNYAPPEVQYGNTTEVGKYRGLDIRFRNTKKVAVQQPTLDLIYRGVAYQAGAPSEAEREPEVAVPSTVQALTEKLAAPVLSIQEKARALMMDHHRVIKQRQQVMLGRLATEVGMPTDEAMQNWSHIQGKIHPTFRMNYDRSHATLS